MNLNPTPNPSAMRLIHRTGIADPQLVFPKTFKEDVTDFKLLIKLREKGPREVTGFEYCWLIHTAKKILNQRLIRSNTRSSGICDEYFDQFKNYLMTGVAPTIHISTVMSLVSLDQEHHAELPTTATPDGVVPENLFSRAHGGGVTRCRHLMDVEPGYLVEVLLMSFY